MVETERAAYEITRRQNNYFWLEVLRGGDQGIRVSVPIRDENYDDHLQDSIKRLNEGEIIEAILVSDDEKRPSWRFKEIHAIENEQNQSPVRANA
jgi:hypothetical protein